jgi:tetratricopeptide (TPR) repeat protein
MRILILLLFIMSPQDINKTAKINNLKAEAHNALESKNYKEAIRLYSFLLDSLEVKDYNIRYNLSQAYYKEGKYEQCKPLYQGLLTSEQRNIQSLSYLQLGIISFKEKKDEEAMNYFKESLRANPSNAKARYNYELLKKLSELTKDSDKSQQQDSPQQDIEPSEFAKNLKNKADILVNENRYGEALKLMKDGLEIDQTVNAYNEFIQRLHTIVEIDR